MMFAPVKGGFAKQPALARVDTRSLFRVERREEAKGPWVLIKLISSIAFFLYHWQKKGTRGFHLLFGSSGYQAARRLRSSNPLWPAVWGGPARNPQVHTTLKSFFRKGIKKLKFKKREPDGKN
jgi:hypothetical protein